jgi:hypothetical protein
MGQGAAKLQAVSKLCAFMFDGFSQAEQGCAR